MDSLVSVAPFAFVLFGLVFGSFANVVIWRYPRGESLSSPASRCPRCGTPIAYRDNIPVLSWLLLRGRCRACGAAISPRYPLVEAVSGGLWLLAWVRFGLEWRTLFAVALFYLLLILAGIDLDTRRLPNPIVGLLAAIGAAGALVAVVTGVALTPLLDTGGALAAPLAAAGVGALVSAGPALLIALAYERLRGRQGFGMGDVKLLAALGLFLGPYGFLVLFVGSIIGGVAGVVVARGSEEGLASAIPFGPFLAVAAVMVAIAGPEAVAWYTGLFR